MPFNVTAPVYKRLELTKKKNIRIEYDENKLEFTLVISPGKRRYKIKAIDMTKLSYWIKDKVGMKGIP